MISKSCQQVRKKKGIIRENLKAHKGEVWKGKQPSSLHFLKKKKKLVQNGYGDRREPAVSSGLQTLMSVPTGSGTFRPWHISLRGLVGPGCQQFPCHADTLC